MEVNEVFSFTNQTSDEIIYLKYKGKESHTFLTITDSVKVFYLIKNLFLRILVSQDIYSLINSFAILN